MNDPDECFAYAEHLNHEHGRLNRLLLEIGHEMAQLGRPDQPQELVAHLGVRIANLCTQLQAHYAEEEAGACLQEAVTRCPSLAMNARTILGEHPELVRMLEHIAAQTSATATKPSEIQQAWQMFSKKFHAHEAAETRLLQMAFGAEAADLDVEGDA
jgi:hypothetical protein